MNEDWQPSEERDSPVCIDDDCPECGTELVLYDKLDPETMGDAEALADPEHQPDNDVWYDEWVCPNCLDGVHMDWPEERLEQLTDESEFDEDDAIPLGDL